MKNFSVPLSVSFKPSPSVRQYADVEMREARPRNNAGFNPNLNKRPRQSQDNEPQRGRPDNGQGFQVRRPAAAAANTDSNAGMPSVPNQPTATPQPAAPVNRVRNTHQVQMPAIQRRAPRANYDVIDQLQGTAAKISYVELFKQAPAIRRKMIDTLQQWDSMPTAQANHVSSIGSTDPDIPCVMAATTTHTQAQPFLDEPGPIMYPGNHIGVLKAVVGINGQKISAIVDSGATHCMMSDILAKKLLIFDKLCSTAKTFKTASGSSTRPVGVIYDVLVNLGSTCLPVDIYISKATNYTMLLANSFLGPAGVNIDFANKCIRCRLGSDMWESIPMDFQSMGRERNTGPKIIEAPTDVPDEEQQLYIEEDPEEHPQLPQPTSQLDSAAPSFYPTDIIQDDYSDILDSDSFSEVSDSDNGSHGMTPSELSDFYEYLSPPTRVNPIMLDPTEAHGPIFEPVRRYPPDSDEEEWEVDCLGTEDSTFGAIAPAYTIVNDGRPRQAGQLIPLQPIIGPYDDSHDPSFGPPIRACLSDKEGSVYNQGREQIMFIESPRQVPGLRNMQQVDQSESWIQGSPATQFLAFTAALTRDRDDFMLERSIFRRIDARFGPHDVDACANLDGRNSQIPTWYWTKESSCLHQNWADFNIWCHPPWHLIDQVIDRYIEFIDTCQLTLVVPNWTWAPWYPKLMQYFHLVEFFQYGSAILTVGSDTMRPQQSFKETRWQFKICRGKTLSEVDQHRYWGAPYQHSQPIPATTTDSSLEPQYQVCIGRKEGSQLTPTQEATVNTVLTTFQDTFAWTEAEVGQTFIHAPPINTGDAQPLKQRPYRNSRHEDEIIQKQVEPWLEQGVIERSASAWSSPVVLVPKKALDPDNHAEEKRYRMCIDYRKLNALTQTDSFPLPNMQDALDSLGQSTVFSIIDLRSAFLQLPLQLADKEKTAFTVKSGLYHFNTLPFGLKNSPSVFQRLMHRVLGDLMYHICMVYLDDIIVYSQSFEEHMEDLTTVFNRLRRFQLKVHPEKTILATDQVIYLGHLCSAASIAPEPHKLAAVETIQPPTTITGVRSFLGLIGYYRRFVKDFAAIALPLYYLLHNDVAWTWTEEQQTAFETLRQRLLQAPILAQPNFGRGFILQTDWSTQGIGAVLTQKDDDNKEHPVSYYSRSLTSAEMNYSASEGEALAVVAAVRQYRPYLHGKKFFLQTDHIALKWLMTTTNLKGKLARWAFELQEYDFDITYRKGASNGNADALSRLTAATIQPFPDDAEEDMEPAAYVFEDDSSADDQDLQQIANEDIGPSTWGEETSAADIGKAITPQKISLEDPSISLAQQRILGKMSLADMNEALILNSRMKAIQDMMQKMQSKNTQEPEALPKASTPKSSTPSFEDLDCEICGSKELAEEMLICDNCDKGYHMGCLNPPLIELPSGDKWTCKRCIRASKMDVTEDKDLLYYLRTGNHTQNLDTANKKRVSARAKRYTEEDGKLYFNDNSKFGARPIPPMEERTDIIKSLHEIGHFAVRRTANLVQERYYWPGIFEDTSRLVRNCEECNLRNIKYLEKPQLKSIPINDQAFYRVGLDLVGPITVTNRDNRYLVVAVDFLTKWPEVAALTNKRAETIAAFFEEYIIARHGCPREVLTDNGTEFRGDFDEMLDKYGIDHRRTSPQRPQTNGMTERLNCTIVDALNKVTGEHVRDWDLRIPQVLLGYRATLQESTKASPFFLVYARHPLLPIRLSTKSNNSAAIILEDTEQTGQVDFAAHEVEMQARKRSRHMMEVATPTAIANITQQQQKHQSDYAKKHSKDKGYLTPDTFHPGDFVVIKPRGRRPKIPKPQIILKAIRVGAIGSQDQGKILICNNDPTPKQWWEPATSLGLYARHDEVVVVDK